MKIEKNENGNIRITEEMAIEQENGLVTAFHHGMQQMCDATERENKDKNDVHSAIGVLFINDVEYQIQVSLIADKKLWMTEQEIRFSECVKIHE